MTTARQLITSAMQNIGALVKSETMDADEAADGLRLLNQMIGLWSNESLTCVARVLENFPLSSAATYTIGPSQTFNTIRPILIVEAHVRIGTLDYILSIVPDETYQDISYKSETGIPYILNYTNGYPTGLINIYPVPISGYTLYLLSEKALSQFSTLDDVVSLPPGWELALIYNLSVLLAPQYGQQVAAEIVETARLSKSAIQMAIAKNRSMDCQPGTTYIGNIYNGWYY